MHTHGFVRKEYPCLRSTLLEHLAEASQVLEAGVELGAAIVVTWNVCDTLPVE